MPRPGRPAAPGQTPVSQAQQALNSFVLWISLPALILVQVPALLENTPWGPELLIPASMAWIQLLLAWALFSALGRWLNWPRTQVGALLLVAGLGNTSFVGYPILDAYFGPAGVRIGVLTDQPGSFLALSTLGLVPGLGLRAFDMAQAGRP